MRGRGLECQGSGSTTNGSRRCGDHRSLVLQQRLDAIHLQRRETCQIASAGTDKVPVNPKTAKALGSTVPSSLLVRRRDDRMMSPTSGFGTFDFRYLARFGPAPLLPTPVGCQGQSGSDPGTFRPTRMTQGGHWPVNDPESGDGVTRRQAGWRQDPALFIGAACYQKRQRTKPLRACELKPIAIQWVRPSTVDGMNLD